MRYHHSLGIGHTYSHDTTSTSIGDISNYTGPESDLLPGMGSDSNIDGTPINEEPEAALQLEEEDPDPDDPELTMDDRENEDLGPELESELRDDGVELGTELDDDLFEMYFL